MARAFCLDIWFRDGIVSPMKINPSENSSVLKFYRDGAALAGGRSWSECLALGDDDLEHIHDFIQWLFPLPETSMFNPWSPLLTEGDIEAFAGSLMLRERLLQSFSRMLCFYGFAYDGAAMTRTESFTARSQRWLYPGNHNHYRISRILRSLSLLGHRAHARQFLKALREVERDNPGKISPQTMRYWREAVGKSRQTRREPLPRPKPTAKV